MFHSTNDLVQGTEKYEDGYYIGTVTSNNDPLGIGRVQATVPGLYDVNLGPLPWIAPMKDSPFGFGTGTKGPYGVYGTPQKGSKIRIELQNGDEHKPLYGPLYTAVDANPTFASPTVWGFADPDGNMVVYDMNAHTYKFVTAGGAVITIDANGKRITAVNGDTTNSNGNWAINVTGNASIQASGTISFQAGGSATYTAATHTFHGPITADSTVQAAGDITDSTSTGNGQTMHDMRTAYNEHYHEYDDNGHPNDTAPPTPQIPN